MRTLCGAADWRALDRWGRPCDRPTYRDAVIELAPGLVAHGIAIAVTYDEDSLCWQAADARDQSQLEHLWEAFLLEGSPGPLVRHGSHAFVVIFRPAWLP